MTNPERPVANEQLVTERMQQIINFADETYGSDALFAYPRPKDQKLVTMKIRDIMAICGDFIAMEDDAILQRAFGRWHRAANILEQEYPQRFARSRELGELALGESREPKS